jgi:predicted secreted protein
MYSSPGDKSDRIQLCHFVKNQYWNTVVSGVYPGVTIVITPGSNPTTGFTWPAIAQVINQDILKYTDHKFIHPGQTGVVGATGQDTWTFKAIWKGTKKYV